MVGLSHEGGIALGIIVGILSTSIQSVGLTLQRKSHILEDGKEEHHLRRPPYRRLRWQLGMLMFLVSNIVGSTIQITTLPLPVLSTLQASGLVFNSICAAVILGEPFTYWSLIGTILVAGGALLIALYGALSEPSHKLSQLLYLLGRQRFINWISFTMVVVVAILIGAWLLRQAHLRDRPRWRLVRGMAYGAVSGILSAHCLLIAKTAVELLVRTVVDKKNQFKHWQSWIILLTLVILALTQLYYLHLGLKLCSTSVLYPFVFCVYNVIAILDGLIYFRQMSRLSAVHAGLIALGTVILLSGVVALSWRLQEDDVGVSLSQPGDLSASTPLLGHSRARSSTTTATLAPGLYCFSNSDPLANQQEDNHAFDRHVNDEEAHAAAMSSPAVTETSPLLPNSATSTTSKFSWFSRHKRRNSQSSGNSGHNSRQRSRRSSRTVSSMLRKPRRPVTVHETAELWAELNDNCDGWVNSNYRSGSESYLNGFGHKRRSTSGMSFSLAGDVGSTDAGGVKRESGRSRRDGLRTDGRRASSGSYLASKVRSAAAAAAADADTGIGYASQESLKGPDTLETTEAPQNNDLFVKNEDTSKQSNSTPTNESENESTKTTRAGARVKDNSGSKSKSKSKPRESTSNDNSSNPRESIESASRKADDTRTSAHNDDEKEEEGAIEPGTERLTLTTSVSETATATATATAATTTRREDTNNGTDSDINNTSTTDTRSESASEASMRNGNKHEDDDDEDDEDNEDNDEDGNKHNSKSSSSSTSPSPPPTQEPSSMLSSFWRRFVSGSSDAGVDT